jgi:hypothetical protein
MDENIPAATVRPNKAEAAVIFEAGNHTLRHDLISSLAEIRHGIPKRSARRLSHHFRMRSEIVAAIEYCRYAGDCVIDDKTSGTNCSRLIARRPSAISNQTVGELRAPDFGNLFKFGLI